LNDGHVVVLVDVLDAKSAQQLSLSTTAVHYREVHYNGSSQNYLGPASHQYWQRDCMKFMHYGLPFISQFFPSCTSQDAAGKLLGSSRQGRGSFAARLRTAATVMSGAEDVEVHHLIGSDVLQVTCCVIS
jgi:hypothetical protein